ncbi:MAG: hypothetical protein ACR2HC_01830 [Thermoleophilaceae bacterium]
MEAQSKAPQFVALPPDLARERGTVLHRALRGLPIKLLDPLAQGLRRHSDSLMPGHLVTHDGGGCAVGLMLREIAQSPEWQRDGEHAPPAPARRAFWREASIYDTWPEIAAAYPRLHHLEIIFDVTCTELRRRDVIDPSAVPRTVGLWMAGETQAEINMRHVEEAGVGDGSPLPPRSAPLDEEVFTATVDRLCELRPWLSRQAAVAAVEALIGARRLEPDPLFMPSAWEREVELQQERLSASR